MLEGRAIIVEGTHVPDLSAAFALVATICHSMYSHHGQPKAVVQDCWWSGKWGKDIT